MVLKSYFDGGNQADSQQYEILTLAMFAARPQEWDVFEEGWAAVLEKHSMQYLHTADMAGTKGSDAFIGDCVSIIEECAVIRIGGLTVRLGIRPVTVSVLLSDFKRALKNVPDLGAVEHLCAIQAVDFCLDYGLDIGCDKYSLYFDRNEPFRGHIKDRMDNRKARRDSLWKHIVHVGESDMRDVPALQAADLLAWSVNHAHEDGRIRFEWQERILLLDREKEWFDYDRLIAPLPGSVEAIKSWNLPRRKSMR